MKVTQEPIRLDDLLNKYNKLEIPLYQREYSWDIEQVSDLFYDISDSEDHSGHFFGSILIYCEDEKNSLAEIIDGQQKLATFFLLINSFKNKFEEIKDSETVEKIKGLIYVRPKGFSMDEKSTEPKLETGRRDNEVFQAILKGGKVKDIANMKIKSHKLLLKASQEFFESRIHEIYKSEKKVGLVKFLNKVVQSEFIVMTAEKKYDRILLFKTLNVRGLELTQSDLVKNEICRESKGISVDEAVDIWDEIRDILDEAKANIDVFLFHYINSLMDALELRKEIDEDRKIQSPSDYVPFVPEKYVFDVFESKLKAVDVTSQLLNDLKKAAEYYKEFLDPSEENIHLVGLRVLNITKCYPLLLRAKKVLTEKNFKNLCKAIEALSLKHSINRFDPKDLEKLYYKILNELKSDKELPSVTQLIKEHPTLKNENKFKEEFKNASPKNIVSKYILFRLTAQHQEGIKWRSKDIHLEHIMPKKPRGEWSKLKQNDPDNYEEFVDRIGNLTLLQDKLNQGACNKDFKMKKKEYYSKSRLKINKDTLTKYNDWNYKTIGERQKEIYKLIKDIWNV